MSDFNPYVAASMAEETTRAGLIRPDFEACGNCGADAQRWVVWDPADGWSCNHCCATDGGD